MESRCKTDTVMTSTRSGQGVGLAGNGVQVSGYRGFLMVALLLVTATTFGIEDVQCTISTEAVAPAPKPWTQQTGDVDIETFNRYEEDALNDVFKIWSKQNPQFSTLLNWSPEVHPCNLTGTDKLFSGLSFEGAWRGVKCFLELQNITEFAKYYRASVISLRISGSSFNCEIDGILCGFDGIIGELPSEISNLTNLQSLTINHNPRLTGRVPIQLFQMPNLFYLVLSNNSLSGALPSEVGNADCTLQTLDLSYNNFSGRLPVSSNGHFFSPYLYDL